MKEPEWQAKIQSAQIFAQKAKHAEFLTICQQIIDEYSNDPDAVLHVGAVLLNFGFHSSARSCFKRVCTLTPKDLRPVLNLANLALEAGDHSETRRIFSFLLDHLPDSHIVRRNVLLSQEYDPDVLDIDRKIKAKLWGEWAITQAGGLRPRPAFDSFQGRQLKIGYVSADFCQHTVGLFVKDVIA
ncbi:MAG: hypothetical protein KAR13_20420, partial [Desulfobulbaceae bacterium]|nr:hypothetical protein [Desulfobulbaceae bacterium]